MTNLTLKCISSEPSPKEEEEEGMKKAEISRSNSGGNYWGYGPQCHKQQGKSTLQVITILLRKPVLFSFLPEKIEIKKDLVLMVTINPKFKRMLYKTLNIGITVFKILCSVSMISQNTGIFKSASVSTGCKLQQCPRLMWLL